MPADAEFFVVTGRTMLFTDIPREDIPEWAEVKPSGSARFEAGDGILAEHVPDSTWRNTWKQLVPVDGDPIEVLPPENDGDTREERAAASFRQTRANVGGDGR